MGAESNLAEYEGAVRVRAIESLLKERGILSDEYVNAAMEFIGREWESTWGPAIVAKAWADPKFKKQLLADPAGTLSKLLETEVDVVVVENTDSVHNLSVCTLCSCYPTTILGFPPEWYKSPEYRSRAVSEPRKVLKEFGVDLGDDVEIRVWDSLAPPRHMILPQRPAGTEGKSEEELAKLVTREMCIGMAR